MERTNNIPDDFDNLEKYAPTLHKTGKVNPFVVPQGYFETLPEVLNTVASISRVETYQKTNGVPEGYFDKLPSFIQSQAALSEIEKKNPFKVPADYFDYLPARIQERIQQTNEDRNWLSKILEGFWTPRFIYAAAFAILILTIGIYTLSKPVDDSNKVQLSELNQKDISETAGEIDESYLIEELTDENVSLSENSYSENGDDNIEEYLINNIDVSTLVNEME